MKDSSMLGYALETMTNKARKVSKGILGLTLRGQALSSTEIQQSMLTTLEMGKQITFLIM